MKPSLLLIDNQANVLTRYVNGQAWERYDITDRKDFNMSFTERQAEMLRTGRHIDMEEAQRGQA